MEDRKKQRIRKKRIRKAKSAVWTAIVLLAALYLLVFHVNTFSLSIRLQGEAEMQLEYGEPYQEPGAQVLLHGTLFWKNGIPVEEGQLQIDGAVEPNHLGRYTLTYQAEYRNLRAAAERTISVIDTVCPVITLTEDSREYVPGTDYVEPGFTAFDNVDGDITDRVIRSEETGKIVYAVTDHSGNPAVVERMVEGLDPLPPVITLTGGEDYRITTGTVYEEPGYTAQDNVDGDLTASVKISGKVDWLTPGTYPVTYRVMDSSKNVAELTRQVTVEAAVWPDTVYPEGKTIYLTFDDGPSAFTSQLLNVLDSYGVKATFFVTDSGYHEIMQEIVNRGHSIGIHSVSHDYKEIYSSPEAFFADLYQMQEIIYENTGVRTTLMRFPGGSSNDISSLYCYGIMTTLTQAVRNAGFQFFDWNVYSGDAGLTTDPDKVLDYVISGIGESEVAVILQHDIYPYSIEAVEEIIQWGMRNGYHFLPLQPDSPGFHQELLN